MKTSILFIIILSVTLFSQPSINGILEKIENNQNMEKDITASIILTQKKINQGTQVFNMVYYRRDSDNSFLIYFIEPEVEKGNGYLRVDNNFWMYRKNTRTFQHINRDESIGGTEVSGEDFESRKLTKLYKAALDSNGNELITETVLGKIAVYKLEVVAKVNDVSHPKKIFWVRRDNFLPLKEQGFAGSGTLMITIYYLKYTSIDNHFVAVKQVYVDEFEKGNKSIVQLLDISNNKLDETIFTKAYLENISK